MIPKGKKSLLGQWILNQLEQRRITWDMFCSSMAITDMDKILLGAAPPPEFEGRLFETLCILDEKTQTLIIELSKQQREQTPPEPAQPPPEFDADKLLRLLNDVGVSSDIDTLQKLSKDDYAKVLEFALAKMGAAMGLRQTEIPGKPKCLL